MSELYAKYWGSFVACCLIVVVLQTVARNGSSSGKGVAVASNPKFVAFQRTYLTIFLLAMFADWLQGPYVYELYVSYGFDQIEIAQLFVCGFGSSMIFGTFVGGMADKYGRKIMCLLYCVCYIIACITKLFNNYWLLMVGRFLSGIATSLLFSAFESWMVCEHHKQGFDSSLLGQTFSYATFGNGVAAVLAGLVANFAADTYGFVAPFVIALVPLAAVFFLTSSNWNENYGNQSTPMMSSLIAGFNLIRNDPKIAALGMAQSCFEGAMYTFVFMWTPALKTPEEVAAEASGTAGVESTADYLGLIFAVYMICVMIGSTLFQLFSFSKQNLYKIPLVMHAVACGAMFLTSVSVGTAPTVVYVMFLLFETCVGVFYPAYGCIKSEKIPEEIRSAVMNIFRIPLNLFVLVLLLKIKYFSSESVFMICAVAHAISFVCYAYFYSSSKQGTVAEYESVPKSEMV
jgi:MFS transporter, MFS domain-containing protein family, molybdate-anion transporter